MTAVPEKPDWSVRRWISARALRCRARTEKRPLFAFFCPLTQVTAVATLRTANAGSDRDVGGEPGLVLGIGIAAVPIEDAPNAGPSADVARPVARLRGCNPWRIRTQSPAGGMTPPRRRLVALFLVLVTSASFLHAPAASAADVILPIQWNINATTHIKSINMDVVVPQGTFTGQVNLTTGDLTGNIALPPATKDIKLFGLKLASATFAMAPAGPITGKVDLATMAVTVNAVVQLQDLQGVAGDRPVAQPGLAAVHGRHAGDGGHGRHDRPQRSAPDLLVDLHDPEVQGLRLPGDAAPEPDHPGSGQHLLGDVRAAACSGGAGRSLTGRRTAVGGTAPPVATRALRPGRGPRPGTRFSPTAPNSERRSFLSRVGPHHEPGGSP